MDTTKTLSYITSFCDKCLFIGTKFAMIFEEVGWGIHYDEYNSLDDDSTELIIEKIV